MTSLDQKAGTQEAAHIEPALKEPLRVGLLIDSYVQPRWIYRIISDIESSTVANLVLIVKNDDAPEKPESILQKLTRIGKQLNFLLYKIYSRMDARLFADKPDAFEKISIQPLLGKVPVVCVKPLQKKFTDE